MKFNSTHVYGKKSHIPLRVLMMINLAFGWLIPTTKRQIIMRVNLIVVLLIAGFLQVSANGFAQKITLQKNNISLEDVFKEIRKQSGYNVLCDAQILKGAKKISVALHDSSIDAVLEEVFNGLPVEYTIANKTIVVKKSNLNANDEAKRYDVAARKLQEMVKIVGTVKDTIGRPLVGVSITIKGTRMGTSTDLNGNFVLEAPKNASLMISYISFVTQEIQVNNRSSINIILKEDNSILSEVAVVGFGQQRKVSLVGAQSTVSAKDLQVPAANLTNTLAGKLSGVVSVQRTSEPGYDNADIWIRGISTFSQGLSKPLVLVDGTPREMANVDPEDIENFTVLKDASATAIYGVRGANGVIIINTKKGAPSKPKIAFRYYEGATSFTKLPEFADGPTFMRMSNEAITNRGGQPLYSDAAIQTTIDGTDPDLHPNVDWMKELFRDYGHQRRANINVSGGSDRATYYIGTSYFDETGMYKTDETIKYNNNTGYKRYNLTSNVSVKPTNTTTLALGVQGYLANANYPATAQGTIFENAYFVTPILHPIRYSDGKIPDVRSGTLQNPYALMTETGYANQWRNQLFSNLRVTQDLPFILDGLSATAMFSFDVYNYTSMRRTKTPDTYIATGRDADGNLQFDQTAIGERFLSFGRNSIGDRTIYVEGALNYNKSFGKHDVGGLLLYNQSDKVDSQAANFINSLPFRFLGVSGRATYGYDNRYFVEGNFGYNGAENFAPNKRYGFFPSFGLGWVISEESFFGSLKDHVQMAKIRFSHGLVGNSLIDANRRFAYISTIATTTGYSFGKEYNNNYTGYDIGEYGVDVQWETAKKTNLGLDLNILNNALTFQVDYFKEVREGIFLRRSAVPGHLGLQNLPYGNLGMINNEGVDGSFTFNKRWRSFTLQLLGNLTYNRNKIIQNDQPAPTYPWMDQRGRKVGQRFGYQAMGLFETEDQIKNGPLHTGIVKPGDIRFQDVNGDGLINSFDAVPIGYGTIPELVYGFGFSLGYKQFSISTLFQGVGNVDIRMNGEGVMPFQVGLNRGNLLSNIEDRWTIDNPSQDVFYPRLSDGNINSNYQYSTWWLKNGKYLRLKNLQVNYELPKSLTKRIKAGNASIFVSGYNLLTWSPFDFWDVELGDGRGTRYPNVSTYTVGISLNF